MKTKHESDKRVWLDITSSRSAGIVYSGTTRVEWSLIRELPACLPGRVGFSVYNWRARRFFAVPSPPLPDAAAVSVRFREHGRGAIRSIARNIERRTRAFSKKLSLVGLIGSKGPIFSAAQAGDTLLLAGENWSHYDFLLLRKLKRQQKLRIAAVLQDMAPCIHPQFFDQSGDFARRFQAYIGFLAEDVDLIFTPSMSTREDFLRAMPAVSAERVVQIELGADVIPEARRLRPKEISALDDRPFVLAVSTIQSRKNFDLLYRIWQRFKLKQEASAPRLVIVGRPGFGSGDLLYQMRHDPSIADNVTILHTASDAELAWLYDQCLFTLYPSWYEGWGLPLTESIAYGKTYIASDRSSLPEAGRGLGIHLDPYDLPAWSSEVLRLACNLQARAEMEQRLLAERRVPSWADCARSISDILEQGAWTQYIPKAT
jgi:glycosyltransferase involved in cell wall biosynthesis